MKRAALGLLLLLTLSCFSFGQRHRDPLNDKEADELREVAAEPLKRMKLLVGYAKARMATVEQMRANPTLAGANGPDEIRKLLEDMTALVDETDENLVNYKGKDEDLRKPLKLVIESDSDLQLKLRALRETAKPDDLKRFGFALDTAIDSVNSSADSARAMLEDQNETRGKEKPLTAREEEKQRKQDEKEQRQKERNDHELDKRQRPCPAPC
jgi:hypothetical protein